MERTSAKRVGNDHYSWSTSWLCEVWLTVPDTPSVREATDQCVRIFSKDKLRRELRQELVMLNPAIKELCQKRRVQEYEELQGRHELVGRREEERQQFPEDREHQFPQSRQMYGVQDSNTNERSPTPVSDLSSSEEDGELRYAIELSKAEAHALEVQRREQERIRREEDDAALESARQAYLDGNMRRKGINGPKDTMPSLLIDIQSDSTSTSTSSSATPRPVQAPIKAPIEAPISAPIPIASSNRAMETVQPHLVPWIQPRTPSSPSPLAQFSQQQQPHYQTSSPLWNQICAPMQTPRYQQQMNGMNYQTVNPLMYPKEADMSFQPLQYGRQAPPPPPPPRVELLRQQLTGWAAPPAPAATVSGNRNPFLSP